MASHHEDLSLKLYHLSIHLVQVILAFSGLKDIACASSAAKFVLRAAESYCKYEIEKRGYAWLRAYRTGCSFRRQLHALVFPRFIMVGGREESRRCDFFMPSQHHFARTSSLNMKREQNYDAVYHNGRVYVVSGCCDNTFTASIEVFDPIAKEWKDFHSLPKKIVSTAAVSFNGCFFCIGGYDFDSFQRSFEIYMLTAEDRHDSDPEIVRRSPDHRDRRRGSTDTSSHSRIDAIRDIHPGELKLDMIPSNECCQWQVCAHLLRERSAHAAVGYDGSIWIAGGIEIERNEGNGGVSTHDIMSRSVEIFDPRTMTVRRGPEMIKCRYNFKVTYYLTILRV